MSLSLLYTMLDSQPAMADLMRSNGKLYVVVGVVILIFLVLFAFLVFLDIRLRKLEKTKGSK